MTTAAAALNHPSCSTRTNFVVAVVRGGLIKSNRKGLKSNARFGHESVGFESGPGHLGGSSLILWARLVNISWPPLECYMGQLFSRAGLL